jgi:allantoinase
MISVPYSVELNDGIMVVGKSLFGEDFYRAVVDQFDQLCKEGEQSGRVMALCLHPFIINQPFRHKYLEKALEYIAGQEGVWLTTSDDIAAHYVKTVTSQKGNPDAGEFERAKRKISGQSKPSMSGSVP